VYIYEFEKKNWKKIHTTTNSVYDCSPTLKREKKVRFLGYKYRIPGVQINWILWKYRHRKILTMLMPWKRFLMRINRKSSKKEKNNYSSNSAKNLRKIQDKDHFPQQLNLCLRH